MNALSTKPPPSERSHGDLDVQILRVEQSLMANEAALRHGIAALKARVGDALRPGRLVVPALCVAGAVVTLGWLWRWRSAGRAPPAALPGQVTGARRRRLPWMRLLWLAVPMLPAPWRDRLGPTAITSVWALLPLAARLWPRRLEAPLLTMHHVEAQRLAGTWFEVARLPSPGRPVLGRLTTLCFSLRSDGTFEVVASAVNDALADVSQGRSGIARPVPGGGGAKLQFSFWPAAWRWLPLAWRDEWILHIDDAGTEALVGSPGRETIRVLSRQPGMPADRLQAMVLMARQRGFAAERLEFAAPA